MTKLRAFLILLGLALFAGAGLVAFAAERDLADTRYAMLNSLPYWKCAVRPSDERLVRTFANRVFADRHPRWRGVWWVAGSAAYQLYFRFRLGKNELLDAFLKTPSHGEAGCEPLPHPDVSGSTSVSEKG